jgi:hypothetical protein
VLSVHVSFAVTCAVVCVGVTISGGVVCSVTGVLSGILSLLRDGCGVIQGMTIGFGFAVDGTFSIRVDIQNALNIDPFKRSINLSVVFVMSVTTMRTPVIATIHTPSRAT